MLKKMFKLNLVGMCIGAAVLFTAAVLAHYTIYSSRGSIRTYQVRFMLQTESAADFAIYYDVGSGFNELDHQSVQLDVTGEPVEVQFCIPVFGQLERLRFDPARHSVKMVLYSIEISSDGEIFTVPLETLHPANQILHHDWDGVRYSFETVANANDPIIELPRLKLASDISRTDIVKHYVIWLLGGLVLFFFGVWIYRYFFLGK